MDGKKARAWTACLLAGAFSLSACSAFDSASDALFKPSTDVGDAGNVSGFLGGVVSDEPQATLAGRAVLSAGGNAADAVTAMGFMLAVTLPSRAGLGASGACLAFTADRSSINGGVPEAVMFPAVAPANPGAADRPASVPMLARGLFALHARYGSRPFETLITPAEQRARFGLPVSRALVRDLAVVAAPLGVDPAARGVFFANGAPLAEGGRLVQPALGATLAQMRVSGVGDLYQGQLAHRIEDSMRTAGGGLTIADLRGGLPKFGEPISLPAPNSDTVSLLPLPFDGGLATAGALQVLVKDVNALDAAQARALGLATLVRRGGTIDPTAVLAGAAPTPAIGPLPASTTFAALDQNGNAVVCGVSMGNLFGTGRVAGDTGILLAASPSQKPQPLQSLALVWNANLHAFHALAGGSGQEGAPLAAATGLISGMSGQMPATPPEPGRANVIVCTRYLPDSGGSCRWSTDPRGFGLAAGSS